MKKTIYLGLLATCFLSLTAAAQDQTDALRYSQLSAGGTARFMAMGGAFSAVGGDASSLTFNPAGIAVFNKSQLTFSPGFTMQSTSSTYNASSLTGNQAAFTIQNLAWIASWRNARKEALWKGIDFGIAYNRTNDFNSNINIQGYNSNSLTDELRANANGNTYDNLDPYSTQQAYNAYLLNTVPSSGGSLYTNILDPYLAKGGEVVQQKSTQRSGSMGETDISFGGDFNNKLYIGASIGIANIRYNENSTYTETASYQDSVYGFKSFDYNTTLTTTGGGVNFKIGAIYRITDWLRIGAAVHTPTLFSMTDNYSSLISATYDNNSSYPAPGGGTYIGTTDGNAVNGTFNYTLITPMRAMGGIAVVLKHRAIISADYEYVDYSTASLSNAPADGGAPFTVANAAIQQYYMPASNLRFGAEYVAYPFSVRAGYTYYGNPYSSSAQNNSVRMSYSAGVGIKFNRCFVDLAYVLTQYSENYYLYDPSLVSAVQNKTSVSNAVLTFGVNF